MRDRFLRQADGLTLRMAGGKAWPKADPGVSEPEHQGQVVRTRETRVGCEGWHGKRVVGGGAHQELLLGQTPWPPRLMSPPDSPDGWPSTPGR